MCSAPEEQDDQKIVPGKKVCPISLKKWRNLGCLKEEEMAKMTLLKDDQD